MINPSLAGAIPNDSWITKNDVPDPEVLPELPGYHVLVRPVTIKAETKGGIILPEKARDDIAYLQQWGVCSRWENWPMKTEKNFLEERGAE